MGQSLATDNSIEYTQGEGIGVTRKHTQLVRALAWGIGAACMACVPNTEIPDAANIECRAEDPACPEGWTCQTDVGRCIPARSGVAVPEIADPDITPALAGANDTVRVSFAASSPLLRPPEVVWGTPPIPLAFEGETRGRYTYTLAASVGSEGEQTILAELVSKAGGVNPSAVVGVVEVDLTPPALVGGAVFSESVVGPEGTVTAALQLDDAVSAIPTAVLAGPAGPGINAELVTVNGQEAVARFAIPPEAAQGDYTVQLTVSDDAGNTATVSSANGVRVDTEAPAVVASELTLVPGPDNPRNTVATATRGTTLRLSLTFDEPVASVSVVLDGTSEALAKTASGQFNHLLEYTVPAGTALTSGNVYNLRYSVRDSFGNASSGILDTPVTTDFDAPAEPDVDTPDTIRLSRVVRPTLVSPEPHVVLEGATGAVEPNDAPSTKVLVLDEGGTALVQLDAAADGSFGPVAVPGGDREVVTLVAVDAAGNRSVPRKVRDITWTTSLTPRDTTDALRLPHQLRLRPVLGQARDIAPSDPSFGLASTADGEFARTQGASRWRVANGDRGRRLVDHHVVFDPQRQHLLDVSNYELVPGVFFDLKDDMVQRVVVRRKLRYGWQEVTPSDPNGDGNPSLVDTLVFDAAQQTILTAPDENGITWFWTDADTWEAVVFPNAPARGSAPRAMTYDPVGRRTVLFDGDVWSWSERGWEPICQGACAAAGPQPGGLFDPRFAVEPDGSLLLFTGTETWRFENNAWTQVCDSDTCGPDPRTLFAMTTDPISGEVLMHGGCDGQLPTGSDTCERVFLGSWSWDGSAWRCVTPPHDCGGECVLGGSKYEFCNRPGASYVADSNATRVAPLDYPIEQRPHRGAGVALYVDPFVGQVVLDQGHSHSLGGDSRSRPSWRWDGSKWIRRDDANEALVALPLGLASSAMGYHAPSDKAVAVGGVNVGPASSAQYWTIEDGWSSQQLDANSNPNQPSGRRSATLTYHPNSAKMLLFGGYDVSTGDWLSDTYTWSETEGWRVQTSPGAPYVTPDALRHPSGAVNESSGNVILSGLAGDELRSWAFTDAGWRARPATTVPALVDAGESSRWGDNAIFLFGGAENDDGEWKSIAAPKRWNWTAGWPSHDWSGATGMDRRDHAMAYVPERNVIAMYGGRRFPGRVTGNDPPPLCGDSPDHVCGDLLLATDSVLQPEVPFASRTEGSPTRRWGATAAGIPGLGMLLAGGTTTDELSSDDEAWLWDSGADDRPAHVLSMNLAEATREDVDIMSVSVDWLGGGIGGGSQRGLALMVWDVDHWREAVVSESAGVFPEHETVGWTSDAAWWEDGTLNRLLIGPTRTFTVAATSRSPNGAFPGRASVETDYVEVRVTYRRRD